MKKKLDFEKVFQLSERDRKLLWIVGAILIVFVAYYFGYNKIVDKTDQYQTQLTTAKARQKDLADKVEKKDKYIEDTETYKNKYNSIVSGYDNGSSQDSMLKFLSDMETITGGWIKSTTFSTSSPIYTFGKTSSSGTGNKTYTTDMIGYKTTLTLAYEAEYSDFKSLLAYINNYYSKNTIDNVTMSYSQTSGVVSGTMTVSTYCIAGSGRVFEYPELQYDKGTDNIFKSLTFSSIQSRSEEDGTYILSDYDYYMVINSSSSDNDSCIIGKKDDTEGESLLSTNYNELQKVTIHFSGSDGNYTASYQIGDETFPIDHYDVGEAFDPGNSLELLIMSSSRLSDADKSSVSLTLINDSDMNLHVKVCNDDSDNPRVLFAEKLGAISIYE